MAKKILYIDLDNTLVNFQSGIDRADPADIAKYPNDLDEVPHIFSLMDPIDGALDAYRTLAAAFDSYILSTAPWKNPSAWHDKVLWVQKHLGFEKGSVAYKRLILSHHKNLNRGDYLVDDRDKNGASAFEGQWLRYGAEPFETWDQVTAYLLARA